MPLSKQDVESVEGALGRSADDSFNDESQSVCDTDAGKSHATSNKSHPSGEDGSSDSEKLQLARKETTQVFRLRLLVVLVLLLAAVAVSLIIYSVMTDNEEEDYRQQFKSAAEKIQLAFVDIVEVKLPAISSLGVAIIAHGQDHDTQKWPYVTLSSFQERATTAREQSGVLYVHINPEVKLSQREDWEIFSASSSDASWIEEGMKFQEAEDLSWVHTTPSPRSNFAREAPWPIWYFDSKDEAVMDDSQGPYFPTWQMSPVIYDGLVSNENILANKDGLNAGANITFTKDSVAISQLIQAPPGGVDSPHPSTALFALLISAKAKQLVEYAGDPISRVYFPIYDSFDYNRTAVAIMQAGIRWADYFIDILPSSMRGIQVVLHDTCGGDFTYLIRGEDVFPIGEGDLHDPAYNDLKETADFSSVKNIADGTRFGLPYNQDFCPISLAIYPSSEFFQEYNTEAPGIMTMAVALVFVFTFFMFFIYDRLVERRQALVLYKAEQTNAVVASLFPASVRERLMRNDSERSSGYMAAKSRLKGYLDTGEEDEIDDTPIADLFPNCTVMFCDISGFTAWSSTREPAQVFILLQTLYQAFDKIAKRRKVFKVETIGDSYVAVTGLPEPQSSHAVIMSRFASECRDKMNELTRRLENTLGPDTGELSMRFGLHSGPVTAGVLRGDRARFQLFGDTVNTAARLESTGMRNRVHVSEQTQQLLVAAGKQHWLKPRADAVEAKGKGTLRTFWCEPQTKDRSSATGSSVSGGESLGSDDKASPRNVISASRLSRPALDSSEKQIRLVNWISDMLHEHIRKVVALRRPRCKSFKTTYMPASGQNSLDEVAEVIYLPRYNERKHAEALDANDITIGDDVLSQLKEYIGAIANMYRDNPFHNFEHACHVTMATNKFLTRIVKPDIAVDEGGDVAGALHGYTHGINSDPLTLMAIVFSALIHDADHRGVSNAQLAVEDKVLAEKYQNKSVAEQHSLDLSWELFMQPQFEALRGCMFATEADLKRFRQVLVNVVLATDIFDRELNDLRKKRWGKAFSDDAVSDQENNDLRATIVIEHIIQASDVSHTMQHWHIYRKWNQRLFTEMYTAYRQGRMAKDPSTFWYHGEIGFFDNYIIPLAKKLKECNVFGVSSDECLNYALQNRNEWQDRGAQIVSEMMAELAFDEGLSLQEEGEAVEEQGLPSLLGNKKSLV